MMEILCGNFLMISINLFNVKSKNHILNNFILNYYKNLTKIKQNLLIFPNNKLGKVKYSKLLSNFYYYWTLNEIKYSLLYYKFTHPTPSNTSSKALISPGKLEISPKSQLTIDTYSNTSMSAAVIPSLESYSSFTSSYLLLNDLNALQEKFALEKERYNELFEEKNVIKDTNILLRNKYNLSERKKKSKMK